MYERSLACHHVASDAKQLRQQSEDEDDAKMK